MSSVALAAVEARQSVQSTIENLRVDADQYVTEHDGSTLRDLLQHLRTRGHGDELISRAVSGMLTSGELGLTADRKVFISHP